MGAHPAKAVAVLRSVAARMEAWGREEKFGAAVLPRLGEAPDERASEEVRLRFLLLFFVFVCFWLFCFVSALTIR